LTILKELLAHMSRRRFSDLLLFGVTVAELVALVRLTPTFTLVDWVYVSQHLVVLGISFTRRPPVVRDDSLATSLAVAVAYTYPYAQVIWLHWTTGHIEWPAGGLVLAALSACLSLASLLSIGRLFGVRPALRGLATKAPYRFVRHPMYLSYFLADLGYELQEWNVGTVLIVMMGWMSLIYRIYAEERMLSGHAVAGVRQFGAIPPRPENLVASRQLIFGSYRLRSGSPRRMPDCAIWSTVYCHFPPQDREKRIGSYVANVRSYSVGRWSFRRARRPPSP
jgi:protein-S-isoprenylcysteine O-methyltransferase Ste14